MLPDLVYGLRKQLPQPIQGAQPVRRGQPLRSLSGDAKLASPLGVDVVVSVCLATEGDAHVQDMLPSNVAGGFWQQLPRDMQCAWRFQSKTAIWLECRDEAKMPASGWEFQVLRPVASASATCQCVPHAAVPHAEPEPVILRCKSGLRTSAAVLAYWAVVSSHAVMPSRAGFITAHCLQLVADGRRE